MGTFKNFIKISRLAENYFFGIILNDQERKKFIKKLLKLSHEKLKNFVLSKSQSLVSILALVLIFFIPLYPKFPSIEIANTYVRIRLEDFLVAFTYFISLPLIWENRKKFLKNNITIKDSSDLNEILFDVGSLCTKMNIINLLWASWIWRIIELRKDNFRWTYLKI